MSCRIGDLSLSINWFVCEFFSVGEFLSPSCYSVSCLSVSCRVTIKIIKLVKLTKVLASCSYVFKDKGLFIILSISGHCLLFYP